MKRFKEKNSGIIVSQDLRQRKIRILYWIMFVALLFISLVCIFPPIWVFLSCFKDMKEFLSIPPTIIPKTFDLSKIGKVWQSLNFGKYYLNTLCLAGGEWLFCILFNGMGGYVLSRLRPKGTTLIFTLIFWTMLLPTSVNMVPLFMTITDFPIFHFSMIDTFWPMWLMAGANAFYVLLFKSFFNSIPMSYLEAARIDGCTNVGIFTKIILPLSKPIIMVVSIFCINTAWESFLWPYLVVKNFDRYPVAVQLFKLKESGFATDKYMVVLLFSIIPPAIIFMFFSKYIMQGANMSGIKG